MVSKCPSVIMFLKDSLKKGKQIIRNNQKTTKSNLNVIQPMVYKISRHQAFWTAIFSKYPPSTIYPFSNEFSKSKSDNNKIRMRSIQ